MPRWTALPGTAVAAGALVHALPSVTAVGGLRARVLPHGSDSHVALTFDDGPHPDSTPQFLAELESTGVRATFFVLGAQLAAHRELGARIAEGGHEIAVHGWTHRPHLLRLPNDVRTDLARALECVHQVSGQVPCWWRPPHGIMTTAGLRAARGLGLQPVLWSADGREWRAAATVDTVAERLRRTTKGGGVVLLHDSDTAAPAGSAMRALSALPRLIEWCDRAGWTLGPLREHAPGREPYG